MARLTTLQGSYLGRTYAARPSFIRPQHAFLGMIPPPGLIPADALLAPAAIAKVDPGIVTVPDAVEAPKKMPPFAVPLAVGILAFMVLKG